MAKKAAKLARKIETIQEEVYSEVDPTKSTQETLHQDDSKFIFSVSALAIVVAGLANALVIFGFLHGLPLIAEIFKDPHLISNFLSTASYGLNVAAQTASQVTGYSSIGQAAGAAVYFQRVFSYANLCKDVWQSASNKVFGKEEGLAPTSVIGKTIKDTRSITPLIAGGLALNLVTGEGLQNSIIKTVAAGTFGNSFPQIGKFLQSSLVNKILINTAIWSSVASAVSLPRFALAPLMTLSSLASLAYETYNNKYGRTIENTPKINFMPLALLQAETVAGIQLARDGKIDPFFGITSALNFTSMLLKPTKANDISSKAEIKEVTKAPALSSTPVRGDGKTWVEAIKLTGQKGLGIA